MHWMKKPIGERLRWAYAFITLQKQIFDSFLQVIGLEPEIWYIANRQLEKNDVK
jgi:hypothetical protein